jgi:hypothetical protein
VIADDAEMSQCRVMRPLTISLGRKTSLLLLVGGVSTGFSACSSNDTPSPMTPTGGSATQAGTGGAQTQAGSATGGSTAQAGTGSGTSGSASMAGASGSGSGGAVGVSGAGGMSGTTSGGAAGAAGAGTAGTGGTVDPGKLDKFSFFVTSMAGLVKLSKSAKGFGGDLRYGTNDGLTGADKICTELAESSMPGSGAKQWHAFLSTTKVNAKDRIGAGPWYDRTGRVVSMNMAGLLKQRPDADPAIKEDLPNENGIPNHKPNPAAPEDDNHHTLTGSKGDGTLFGPTATCKDWTSSSTNNTTTGDGVGRPKTGFSWSVPNQRVEWIDGQEEGGCGAGITGVASENGPSMASNPIVGSGGGYGGFYCFAMMP